MVGFPFLSNWKMFLGCPCGPLCLHIVFALVHHRRRTMMSAGDQEPSHYYVGIDVGTGSVRAALVDQQGILLAFAEEPIKQWEPQVNHHEQSSEDIWAACCLVTKVRAKPQWFMCRQCLYVCTWWS